MTALAAPIAPPTPLAVFRKQSFTLLWLGQLVTEMGTALTSLAASIYVYQLTGSALHVGLMMMASAAPTLLVGLVAGVFVDRYDRKRIMIAAEVIRFLLIGALPLLMPHGVGWLYIMVMLSGAVGQF